MKDDSRDAVMARSRAEAILVPMIDGVTRGVARHNNRRVAISFAMQGISGDTIRVAPVSDPDTSASLLLFSSLVTAGGGFIHAPFITLNIWDHGDIVRQPWNGIATITGNMLVIETYDPESVTNRG